MTTEKKLHQLLLIITSTAAILSLAACASKPAPVSEIYQDEPVVVASEQANEPYEPPAEQYNEPYEPPVAEPVMEEPMTDTAMMEESSGIAAPADEPPMMEEPAAKMTNAGTSISETPADYYGIQIVASSTAENLQAFASKHGLADNLSTKIVVNGKEWHVLLQGVYPTLEEAKTALAGIQGQFTTSPWIRRIGSLQ